MPGDGFVSMTDLLQCMRDNNIRASHDDILNIIKNDAKARFHFDGTISRVRANNGQSLPTLDLNLRQVTFDDLISLPDLVIHETYSKFVPQILDEGLKRMGRLHIHFRLSEITETNRRKKGSIIAILCP